MKNLYDEITYVAEDIDHKCLYENTKFYDRMIVAHQIEDSVNAILFDVESVFRRWNLEI